jgi:hypothetical protein
LHNSNQVLRAKVCWYLSVLYICLLPSYQLLLIMAFYFCLLCICRYQKVKGATIMLMCFLEAQTLNVCNLNLSSTSTLAVTFKWMNYSPMISMLGKTKCLFNLFKLHIHSIYDFMIIFSLFMFKWYLLSAN